MEPPERTDLEQRIREPWDRGDFGASASAAMRGYGPQILGFLIALQGAEDGGTEAFAMFSEDLWRGLPRFAWQCTFRTWAYTLARHASIRLSEGEHRRRGQRPLSECPELQQIADRVRTETITCLRTETKARVTELRDALCEEDRALLILRVDRRLAWLDLARILLPPNAVGDAPLKREAARLRKRFQLVKQRLLAELGRGPGTG